MRFLGKILLSCVAWAVSFGMIFAQDRGNYTLRDCAADTKFSECVIDRIVGQEKSDTGIIGTDLDYVNKNEGAFEEQLKISNTLDSSRYHLESYLEWFAFLWLSAAVALIVYNGIMLMFSPLSPDQLTAVKKRLMYIILGALMITGFYFVMKVLLSILVQVVVK